MEIIEGLLTVVFIAGFGALFGGALSQLPYVQRGIAVVAPIIFYGLNVMFASYLILLIVELFGGVEVNRVKTGVEILLILVNTGLVVGNRKRIGVSRLILILIAGFALLLVASTVFWH